MINSNAINTHTKLINHAAGGAAINYILSIQEFQSVMCVQCVHFIYCISLNVCVVPNVSCWRNGHQHSTIWIAVRIASNRLCDRHRALFYMTQVHKDAERELDR